MFNLEAVTIRTVGVAVLACAAALAWVGDAHAISGVPAIGPAGPGVIIRSANSAQFVYGGSALPDISRAYANVGTAGAVGAIDTVRVGTVPGTPLVAVQRTATRAAIAAAGAKALQALPTVAVGVALWDIYKALRTTPDGAGGLVHDAGTAPQMELGYCWQRPGVNECYGGAMAACATGSQQAAALGGTVFSISYSNGGASASCKWETAQGFDRYQFGVVRTESEVPTCPASIDFENPAFSISKGQYSPGEDGKCPLARSYHQPITPAGVVGTVLPQFPSVQFTPEVVKDIVDRGQPIEVDSPISITGPTSTPGTPTTTTTTGPSGTTTTTNNTTNNYTYEGDTLTWNITNTTTTTNGDGTTTTTTEGQEVEVCGLPGKPACRMDETGTPTPPEPAPNWWDETLQGLRDFAADPTAALPELPELNWSFELPTGCAAIPLPAFAPFLTEIDICQFQPLFHELMSVVWVMGALFGAIGMFFRNALAYN